jgi:hypothetical protein
MPGRFVPLKDTVRSFREIIEGKHDDLPEQAFKYQGSIDDVIAAVRAAQAAEAEKTASDSGAEAPAETAKAAVKA